MIIPVVTFYGFQTPHKGDRFDWKTTVRKKRQNNPTKKWGKKTNLSWELTIPADNRQDFFTLISPHVIPHFFYKLPVQFRTYTVKHTDGTKEVKFWPQINKNLSPNLFCRFGSEAFKGACSEKSPRMKKFTKGIGQRSCPIGYRRYPIAWLSI